MSRYAQELQIQAAGGTRWSRRFATWICITSACVTVAACSSSSGSAPTSGSTSTNTTSAAQAGGASPTAGSLAGAPTPSTLAALKKSVSGKTVTVALNAPANARETVLVNAVDMLGSEFGAKTSIKFMNSAALNAALISNKVDVGVNSLSNIAAAVDAGAHLTAFAGAAGANEYFLLARAPITTMQQLKGKPVAVSQSAASIVGQTAALCFASVGMNVNTDIQPVALSNLGDAASALASHSVDAGMSLPPFAQLTAAKDPKSTYNTVCKGWVTAPMLNLVVASPTSWLDANKDVAQALTVTILKSSRQYAQDESAWLAKALTVQTGLTSAHASQLYDTYFHTLTADFPANGSLDQQLCQNTLNDSFKFKGVKKQYQCSDIVTFTYQDQAVKTLG